MATRRKTALQETGGDPRYKLDPTREEIESANPFGRGLRKSHKALVVSIDSLRKGKDDGKPGESLAETTTEELRRTLADLGHRLKKKPGDKALVGRQKAISAELERRTGAEKVSKGFYYLGLGNDWVEKWSQKFYGFDKLLVQALQCVKEAARIDKERAEANKRMKSWRELDEMPRTQREAERRKQEEVRDRFRDRMDRERVKMRELDEKLIDEKIREARMRKSDQGGDLRKAGDDSHEWAGRFWNYKDLYVAALQCIKDLMRLEREEAVEQAKAKSWREVEDMPRQKRQEYRREEQRREEQFSDRREKIRVRMRELDQKRIDEEIKQAKVRKSDGAGDLEKAEKPKTTTIQTLIFDKDKFDAKRARAWASEHDFAAGKVDVTEESVRLRQKDPGAFQDGTFRTITLTSGVKAVIGRPKKAPAGGDMRKANGPYIGPRGGKWADPKHTIPWEEGKPAKPAAAKLSEAERKKVEKEIAEAIDDAAHWESEAKKIQPRLGTEKQREDDVKEYKDAMEEAALAHKEAGAAFLKIGDKQKAAIHAKKMKAAEAAVEKPPTKAEAAATPVEKSLVLGDLSKAGPFIGPRGGKWADAKHTIPWDPKKHGKGAAPSGIERMWAESTTSRMKPGGDLYQKPGTPPPKGFKEVSGRHATGKRMKGTGLGGSILGHEYRSTGRSAKNPKGQLRHEVQTERGRRYWITDEGITTGEVPTAAELMFPKEEKSMKKALPGKLTEAGERKKKVLAEGARGSPPKEYREEGATRPEHYADPKNWKYPIKTEGHVRAAISYFSKPKNAGVYPVAEQKAIWGRIKAAAKRHGIELGEESGPPSVQKSLDAWSEAQTRTEVTIPMKEDSMSKSSNLDEWLEKANGLPSHQQRLGGPKSDAVGGSQDGGELDGKGKTSGDNTSAAGAGVDEDGNPTGVPGAEQQVLSDDDDKVEDQVGGAATAQKALTPAVQRELVAHEHAKKVSQLRKGEDDVYVGPSAHPYSMAKSHGSSDEAAAAVAAEQDEAFYKGGSPALARGLPLMNQGVLCKSVYKGGCDTVYSAALTACPGCGAGTVQSRVLPPARSIGFEIAVDERGLRPAKREPDVTIE